MFTPSTETVESVREWLISSEISKQRVVHSQNKAWPAFDAKSAELERLLRTKYHHYEHLELNHNTIACEE